MKRRQRWKSEQGSTLVELAASSIVFFGLLGAFLDFGVTMHREALLRETTLRTIRWASVRTPRLSTCSPGLIEGDAESYASGYIENVLGQHSSDISFTDTTVVPQPDGRMKLEVTGTWDTHCVFCLLYKGGMITVKTEGALEYRCS